MTTRHRGLFWAAIGVLAVVFVGAGLLALRSYSRSTGPAGAVKGYFGALVDGDAPAALSFGGLPEGPRTFLTSTVLKAQQQTAPIANVRIASVSTHGSRATVAVSYDLGFSSGVRTISDTVQVMRHGRNWRLVNAAVATTLNLQQAAHRAGILGAAIPTGTVLMFPGAIPVVFDTPLLQLAASTDNVSLNSPGRTTLTVQVSAAGRTQVMTAVTNALRTCLSAAAKADPSCPLPDDRIVPGTLVGTFSDADLGSITLGVSNDPNGVIEIDAADIRVTGHYQQLDLNNQPQPSSAPITLPVTAMIYPTSPLRIVWSGGQS